MEQWITGGVYGGPEIEGGIELGSIVIEPFNKRNLNGSSYDVRLGEWFYTLNDQKGLKPALFNPYDESHIDRHFDGPHRAKTLAEVCVSLEVEKPKGLEDDEQVIVIQPQQRILGHTEEFIGIRPPGTTSMQARSTIGRLGVNVCQDAGWGDPGYINRWTMEIYNNNPLDPVILAVGTRIAQIVFYKVGATSGEYSNLSGHYQSVSGENLEEIQRVWKPEDMLPKPLDLT